MGAESADGSRCGGGLPGGPAGEAGRAAAGDRRVGVVGIVVTDRQRAAGRVQDILSQYGDMIVGRMGVPYRERDLAVIALIVDGTTDQVGALTGRLGQLPGVLVRSALAPPLPAAPDRSRREPGGTPAAGEDQEVAPWALP